MPPSDTTLYPVGRREYCSARLAGAGPRSPADRDILIWAGPLLMAGFAWVCRGFLPKPCRPPARPAYKVWAAAGYSARAPP